MALTVGLSMRRSRAPEPVGRIPLAWGGYSERYLLGLALLIGGAALVAQTTAYTLTIGLLGMLLHAAGWLVQPGRLRTRALVALPGSVLCWSTLGGPGAMWLLALLLPLWLAVRRRPPSTLLLTAVPLVVALALGGALPYVADKTVVFCGTVAAVVAAALLARELTLHVRVRIGHGPAQAAAERPARRFMASP